MAFVQVKNTLQTWKLAAFIVAFFSPFFSHALDVSSLEGLAPQTVSEKLYDCHIVSPDGSSTFTGVSMSTCAEMAADGYQIYADRLNAQADEEDATLTMSFSHPYYYGEINWTHLRWPGTESETRSPRTQQYTGSFLNENGSTLSKTCPPSGNPSHVVLINDLCYDPVDIDALLASNLKDKNDDNYCKGLVLDSGNNSAANMCLTSSTGKSCNIEKITTDGGGSYYKGVSSSDGGCYSSENPEYDDAGTGDEKDGCIYSEGINYCEANRAKHCPLIGGVEICDDGCIDDGTNVFCDTRLHPDVGEGDSNYFDSNGTCSVISASASRGFCNEMGGVWDETQDYQETSCPTGTGNCSVASAGLCRACFDAGGTWTPDENSEHSDETKASLETGALIKSTNQKLDSIEHGQRMTMESIQSTMKSGDGKVVAAIEALGEKLDKPKEEEEEESFTTTTQDVDKSAFLSMFDSSAQEAIKARVVTAQAEYDSQIRSILAEAKTIFSVTVPNAIGYQARRIELSYGSVDASLSRYSDFFKALAGPIMMLCSLIAALAILRD